MTRKLKTYQTSLGFYDLAIAAPSMKAALEAWGAGSNLFHQGVAKESSDPEVIAATISKPGVVLRRPVGSEAPFSEHPGLPTQLADAEPRHREKKTAATPKERVRPNTDESAAKPSLRSRGSTDGANVSAGRKRPPGRSSGNGAITRSRRPNARLTRLGGSMTSGWRKSRLSGMLSKGSRKRRTLVGRSRRTHWRRRFAGRANSAH